MLLGQAFGQPADDSRHRLAVARLNHDVGQGFGIEHGCRESHRNHDDLAHVDPDALARIGQQPHDPAAGVSEPQPGAQRGFGAVQFLDQQLSRHAHRGNTVHVHAREESPGAQVKPPDVEIVPGGAHHERFPFLPAPRGGQGAHHHWRRLHHARHAHHHFRVAVGQVAGGLAGKTERVGSGFAGIPGLHDDELGPQDSEFAGNEQAARFSQGGQQQHRHDPDGSGEHHHGGAQPMPEHRTRCHQQQVVGFHLPGSSWADELCLK